MSIDIVAAYGRNGELGKDNDLLWKLGEMRKDMANFRKITLGTTVVMGRKTFNSIGDRALPDRENIVITKNEDFAADGVVVAHSIEEALELAKPEANVVNVIGGAAIYAQILPLAERIFATEVDADFPEADVHFPAIDSDAWQKKSEQKFESDDDNKYGFSFVEYERIQSDN